MARKKSLDEGRVPREEILQRASLRVSHYLIPAQAARFRSAFEAAVRKRMSGRRCTGMFGRLSRQVMIEAEELTAMPMVPTRPAAGATSSHACITRGDPYT